ncbi:mitochondrial fission factor homolog B-like isoform X1 [Physella acuta]|uniref:mitochondrial fission factor homolog B-like isoform X1 n=1 Tax=Physella acuta TaxID=109671 RepID=UPI0027DB5A4B|nr:mitochondrial fission factor homolog B-like isoform X1 [Physella acuta]
MTENTEEKIKLPDHTQPSDYSDVHPKTYDPEFISQISSKMQVPDRISVGSHYDTRENGYVNSEISANFAAMSVPDRIILGAEVEFNGNSEEDGDEASVKDHPWDRDPYQQCSVMHVPYTLVVGGHDSTTRDNHHIALKQDLDLDLPSNAHLHDMSYVGLITPPRTLTLEERFPVVEETDDQKMMAGNTGASKVKLGANGHIAGPVPYDPGVNLNDSVLLNEENEATLLRTQVAKLTRRVQVIEQDNQRRAGRELVMYPIILGYFLWKFLGWLTRDR